MNRASVQNELSALQGKVVQFRRMAGNSIILYFDGEPGNPEVVSLWIDPSWRYKRSNEWVLGSGDVPWDKEENESDKEFTSRFNQICDICEPLVGSTLDSIVVASDSSDLTITFSKNQKLVSFAGYTEEENWVYRNKSKGIKIYGSLGQYELKNT